METDKQLNAPLNSYSMDILHTLVLDCIDKGMLQRDMSYRLGVTKARISQIISDLKGSGEVVANRVGIINVLSLSSKGKAQLSASHGLHAKQLRIHNQELKIPLKAPVKPVEWADRLKIDYKMNKMRGHIDIIFTIDGILYRLTPHNLIIHPKDARLDRNVDLLQYYQSLKANINAIAQKIEKSGLPLQRFDKENYKFIPTKLEIAFEDDDIAVEGAKKEKEIKIYDEADGKLRFGIDWSMKDFPEAEFYHPLKGFPDAMNWQDSSKEFDRESIKDLFDGNYKGFKETVGSSILNIMKIVEKTVQQNADFAKNLESHKIAIQELTKLARNINDSFTFPKPSQTFHADSAGAKGKLDWTEILPGVEILKSGKAEEREA